MQENELYKIIRVKEIREAAPDFKTYVFEDGHGIYYKAGQYLTLVIIHHGEEVRRSYSITSSPLINEPLAIGVKRMTNGFFSRQLIDKTKPGDVFTTTGAGGFFILPADIDNIRQLFFFAAGSGITPILSLIKTVLVAHAHISIVLIYSNASKEKTIFYRDLLELSARFPERFHVEFLFSNARDLSKARLHRTLLFDLIERFSISEVGSILYYICGPEAYMRLCTYTLQEMGIKKEQIKKENFLTGAGRRVSLLPPDTARHTTQITIGKKQYAFPVQYPDTILSAAKKQGINLPYSCEAGRCGNCVAKCTSGKVWHSYNEVLTEKELAEGLILTCVGHPVDGDVSLVI